MSGGSHSPGPWIDWDTLEWLIEPQRLLANSADARLIAAAPELLKALDAICSTQAQHYGDGIRTHMNLIRLADNARAILANARGFVEAPCTDCDDTGVTHQTERKCSCDAGRLS